MGEDLRVHIVPVGYDYSRVTEPLINSKADKVYFILHETDRGQSKFLNKIKKDLENKLPQTKTDVHSLDIWNLYSCIQKMKEIIAKEEGNRIFINVSTGTKITAIAGMLSCMSWNATPYYVKFKHPSDSAINKIRKEEVYDKDELPVFELNKPKLEHLAILSLLENNGGKIKKRRLIKSLENKIIPKKNEEGDELSIQAKHSRLRPILHSMENDFRLINAGTEVRGTVNITEQGKRALKIFGKSKI